MLSVAQSGKCLGKGKDGVVGAVHGVPRSVSAISGSGSSTEPWRN
jgi:hypothetical protein